MGQDKNNYLPDDEFLDAHFHLYFCDQISEIYKNYRRKSSVFYGSGIALYNYLLEEYFVVNKIPSGTLTTENVMEYIESLKNCIKIWHIINYPADSSYNEEIVEYITKIHYLLMPRKANITRRFSAMQVDSHKVLLLSCLQHCRDDGVLLKFLKSFEKFLFLVIFIPFECLDGNYNMINLEVVDILKKLNRGDMVVSGVKEKIDKLVNALIADENINRNIILYYSKTGFYEGNFLRYFLCEYEISLQNMSKSHISKLDRDVYFGKGYDSIEHIYPQRARQQYWVDAFKPYSQKQKHALRSSLGNFVAVSTIKNILLDIRLQ